MHGHKCSQISTSCCRPGPWTNWWSTSPKILPPGGLAREKYIMPYSGKLWLAQKLKVCICFKHPQGFREGGVRGGREWGHLRGRPPWPLEAHFAQKLIQSRSHELPLPKKLQKDVKKYMQGCRIGRFIEILIKNDTPRTPKVV